MVKNWPKGKRLQRLNPKSKDYFQIYENEYDENGRLIKPRGKMIPIRERDWPADMLIIPCGDGLYFAGSSAEIRKAMETPYKESARKLREEKREEVAWFQEDAADSCEICAKIPEKEVNLVHCDDGHSFHRHCIERWTDVTRTACPHCISSLPKGIETCPVWGCRVKAVNWLAHIRRRHAPTSCGTCERSFLLSGFAAHQELACAEWQATCPASGCSVETTVLLNSCAKLDASLLTDHHQCEFLFPCELCPSVFYCMEDAHEHAESGKCSMTGGRKRPPRGAKRKATAQLARFSSEEE